MTPRRLSAAILIAASLALPAFAAEPVRHIAIHVEPYYAAADTADAPPRVNIGASFNTLLASTRREDILAAQDKIRAAPQLVTPMTLMVLAIRLYDVAARDDAVFWFYAAKDRFITLSDVADMRAAGLSGVESAIGAFATLAGPAINGYAFCDIANQQAIRATTLDWLEANPYGAIMMERLPAKPGDRAANLARSIAAIRANAAKETAYFADPKNVASFVATRAKNEMDARFCWQ